MKVGLFVTLEIEGHQDMAQHLREIREQVMTARDAGFDSLWVPQHFVTGPSMRQTASSPMLGWLANMAPEMKLGTAVLLLPMLNPVLLAEEAATLDHLTEGGFVLGVGLGYRDHEFAALGIERKSRVGRFREYVQAIRALWNSDNVTFHGKYVHLENVSLAIRPRDPANMPLWIGGTVEDAVKRAAELGDSWQGAGAMSMEEMKRWWSVFHQARIDYGKPLQYARQVSRECFCGPSMARAMELARGPIGAKYTRYAGHGFGGFEGDDGFAQFARDRFVIGDEAYVRDELQRYRDALGATEMRFRMAWPGLSQEEVLASIRRVGRIAAAL